jgi:hypothetical protein
MEEKEWDAWLANIKEIGTRVLGFKIGEVGFEIEWVVEGEGRNGVD